jgi:nickel/cobalt transporter (NicO) family protein
MTDFSHALSQGATHAWLFIPSAILLGALHGLEPGHSKTMMAAFIIAIRGTVWQAVLLGLSAAFSHSLIIWALAAVALKFGSGWNAESTEPYFQIVSAAIIAGLALWMFWRTRRELQAAAAHAHDHSHGHDDTQSFSTSHGLVELSVFEAGVPPVFRLAFSDQGKPFVPDAAGLSIETVRPDHSLQSFAFVARDGFLQSTSDIPEPHEFDLTLSWDLLGHRHQFAAQFRESDHAHLPQGAEFQDAHEAAHALAIQKRFLNRKVTTPQIVLFGLTGGLLPCPAAFTVLLVCLQLKEFSLGLALTMVSVGAVAAWSVRHAEKKFSGFGEFMRKAPYFSCALLLVLASYMAWQGFRGARFQLIEMRLHEPRGGMESRRVAQHAELNQEVGPQNALPLVDDIARRPLRPD